MEWEWAGATVIGLATLVIAYLQLRRTPKVERPGIVEPSELTPVPKPDPYKDIANGRRTLVLTNTGGVEIFGVRVDGFGCAIVEHPHPSTVLKHGEGVSFSLALSTGNTAWYAVTWRTASSTRARPEVQWWPVVPGSDLGEWHRRQTRLGARQQRRIVEVMDGHVAPNAAVRGYVVGPRQSAGNKLQRQGRWRTGRARRARRARRAKLPLMLQPLNSPEWSRAKNPPPRHEKY